MLQRPNITDNYIGRTTEFRKRKFTHDSNCSSDNAKLHNQYVYKFIRENGRWNAWKFVIVKKSDYITDKKHLSQKTQLSASSAVKLPWLSLISVVILVILIGNVTVIGRPPSS